MSSSEVLDIPWRSVRPMPGQPREYFDKAALAELALSIGAVGQLVPAKVCPLPECEKHRYELIDGQRRWHAVQMAGLESLRCEVVDEPDADRRYMMSVVANFSRQAHHPIEVAVACDRLRRSMPIEKVATVLGKSATYVHQHISLLRLHSDLKLAMHPTVPTAGRLPMTAAMELANLEPAVQLEAWARIKSSGASPGRVARRIAAELPRAAPKDHGKKPRYRDEYERARVVVGHIRRTLHAVGGVPAWEFRDFLRRTSSGRADEIRRETRGLIGDLEAYLLAEPTATRAQP